MGLVCERQGSTFYPELTGDPVQCCQNWWNMITAIDSWDNANCIVLHQLKSSNLGHGSSRQQTAAAVHPRHHHTLNRGSTCSRGKVLSDFAYIPEMEVANSDYTWYLFSHWKMLIYMKSKNLFALWWFDKKTINVKWLPAITGNWWGDIRFRSSVLSLFSFRRLFDIQWLICMMQFCIFQLPIHSLVGWLDHNR